MPPSRSKTRRSSPKNQSRSAIFHQWEVANRQAHRAAAKEKKMAQQYKDAKKANRRAQKKALNAWQFFQTKYAGRLFSPPKGSRPSA